MNMNELENLPKMTEAEFYPDRTIDDLNRKVMHSVPLTEIAALGSGFASMPEAFRTVTTTTTQSMDGLYRCIFPEGVTGTLARKKGEDAFLGTIIDSKGLAGQARWKEASDVVTKSVTTMPYNPGTMLVAASLASIEKELRTIKEKQEEMLHFVHAENKADIIGSVKFLYDLIADYKFNYNDRMKLQTYMNKLADLKQETYQNIELYQNLVSEALQSKKLILSKNEISKKSTAIQNALKNYQIAVYLFSYVVYADAVISNNTDAKFLEKVVNDIKIKSMEYRMLYTSCYNEVVGMLDSTLGKVVKASAENAGNAAGKAIAKATAPVGAVLSDVIDDVVEKAVEAPVIIGAMELKESANQVVNNVGEMIEDALSDAESALDPIMNSINEARDTAAIARMSARALDIGKVFNNTKEYISNVSEKKEHEILDKIASCSEVYSTPFVNQLEELSLLHNTPMEVYADAENLYFCSQA